MVCATEHIGTPLAFLCRMFTGLAVPRPEATPDRPTSGPVNVNAAGAALGGSRRGTRRLATSSRYKKSVSRLL